MTEPTATDAATDVAPADARGPLPQGTQIHRSDHDPAALPVVFEIRDLSVYYGEFRAVREVNIDVKQHEITAFIGPSGCGKTTVLRCLDRMNDLIPGAHPEGTILYHGVDLYGHKVDAVEVRRRIGMVFQKPNPFPKSIFDNVAYGPRLFGRTRKADMDDVVEESLVKAALWDEVKDRLKDSANGLSGGQQQRLCIARAIATRPDVLLMDEPCSALDPIATGSHRGPDAGDQGRVHDRHRHAQHAAGGPGVRRHRVLLDRGEPRVRPPHRRPGRVRPHRDDLLEPVRRAHRELHHGAVRLMSPGGRR